MKIAGSLTTLLLLCLSLSAQTVSQRVLQAAKQLKNDAQMRHAILGLYLADAETGEVLVDEQGETGLAPASCQKLFTSIAALTRLGPMFHYTTLLGYRGKVRGGQLTGDVCLVGAGDPSLGSWRYTATAQNKQFAECMAALQKKGIKKIKGDLLGYTGNWETATIPGGWIWDDMGNYYGAGIAGLNWHENQYDLYFKTAEQEGDSVYIREAIPEPVGVQWRSELVAGKQGSGDNAYIYLPPYGQQAVVRGTIPAQTPGFHISGSFPDPLVQTLHEFEKSLDAAGLVMDGTEQIVNGVPENMDTLAMIQSPDLDSLNYWFLKKSINLYGEALLKTMADKDGLPATTENGVKIVRRFWNQHGIENDALQIQDGSGLSPQNRVTPHALVQALQYARTQSWFPVFYAALPEYNGMHLKSGSIGGARSFAGYHTSQAGKTYVVAIMVNNYSGASSAIVQKMFRVLDELK